MKKLIILCAVILGFTITASAQDNQKPLILTEVRPTCGCTIADYTKTPVQKGQKGTISITYNAAVASPFSKTIVVTSNAKTPTKNLVIIGEVVEGATSSK
jgi:hypothetical protein